MANELAAVNSNLPSTIEDLSRFVLIGREKLISVRAEIRAIEKVGLAKEVREQKLAEAQDIADAVLDAEVRIGQLMSEVPKAKGGQPFHKKPTIDTGVESKKAQTDSGVELTKPKWAPPEDIVPEFAEEEPDDWDFLEEEPIKQPEQPKTKAQVIEEAGFSQKQVERFQKMAAHPDIVAQAKAEARENDDIVSRSLVLNMVKAEEKKQKQEEKEARKTFELDQEIPDGYCTLYCADICDGLPDVEDESIDFIITDPPYPKEYLSLYSNLSEVASRVLKPNGSLIVMTGQSYLPEVINRLSENMTYHWCLAYETPGGQSPQLFQKKVNSFWKPVLWFTKESYEGDWIGDVLKSPVNDNDKRYHEWGQSLGGIKDIVKRFTNPSDTILDPFLGGGTTGVAAVTMKRKFIGTDIDQKNINVSNERIKKVYAECLN